MSRPNSTNPAPARWRGDETVRAAPPVVSSARADLASAGLLAAWAVAGLAFVFWGRYAGDEGWYSLISREALWGGRLLYRDIRFTQMPLLPYFYGVFVGILPARIEALRLVSWAVALSGMWAGWRLVRMRYGPHAAAAALALIVVNRGFPYHVTNVKTQAFTFAACTWAFYFLASALACHERGGRGAPARFALSGLFAGGALLARLSALPVALAIPAGIVLACRGEGRARAATAAAAGALLLPAGIAAFFYHAAGDQFLFGIYRFHVLMGERTALADTFPHFWRHCATDALPWLLATFAATVLLMREALRGRPARHAIAFELTVLAAFAAATLIHCTRKPAYSVYQVGVAWGPFILSGYLAHRASALAPRWRAASAALIGATALAIFPFGEGWLHFGGNRTPAAVHRAAAPIRAAGRVNLVTLDAGIAFCAPQAHLMRGYEMADFAMQPPAYDEEQERTNGVGVNRYLNDLASRADWATVSPRDLRYLPRGGPILVDEIIANNYEPVLLITGYGQFDDKLIVLKRKPPPTAPY